MNEQMNIEGDKGADKVSIIDLDFTSNDGQVEYRFVYSDGTKGQLQDAGFQTNNPNAQRKFQFLKEQNVGKPKEE